MPTFYVTVAGNDGNTGQGTTAGLAWKTLTPVNARTWLPGDICNFNGGETFTGNVFIQNVASTQASPVTFQSYGTGRATINTTNVANVGFYVYKMGGMVIQNLNFTGPGVTSTKEGIFFYNDAAGNVVYPYVRIINCNITGYMTGIVIGGGAGTAGYSDIRIDNCEVFANRKNGIQMFGSANYALANVYIGNTKTYNNTGLASQSSPTGSGIELSRINGGTVELCTSFGNGSANTNVAGPVGIWCYSSNNVVIQKCESYDNLSGGGDGDGFDLDGGCTNCTIQYCYSHGNKGAGFALFQYAGATTYSGNVIRYCISENDKLAGIALWGANTTDKITNSSVYNNTIYASLNPALDVYNSNLSGITVSNNIFLTINGVALVDHQGTTGLTFTRNNYYPVSGAFTLWWGGTNYASVVAWGVDATGLSVNPQLTGVGAGGTIYPAALTTLSAYKISSGSSPMISAGTTITSPGSTDFWGDTLFTGAADVGADEYIPPAVTRVFMPMSAFVIQ
jgi:Right handed beta helix region